MITLTVSVCGSASSLDDVFSFFYSGYRAKQFPIRKAGAYGH